MNKLILASQSPRRRKLLQEAGYSFDIVSIEISEFLDKNLILHEQLNDLSRRKAKALLGHPNLVKGQGRIVLSADTVVAHNGEILGKPLSETEAVDTLRSLSGQKHMVLTSVSVWDFDNDEFDSRVCETGVAFKDLTDKQITDYVKSGDPMDKAGAYGIQTVFNEFVESIEGPFDNVVGLPLDLVKNMLSKWSL